MKSRDLFWPGFVGLMTIMFVIMLVLFGLSFKVYTEKTSNMLEQNRRLKGVEKEYTYIQRKTRQAESFKTDTVFEFLPIAKKYIIRALKGKAIFVPDKGDIQDKYLKEIITAGHSVENYINRNYQEEWESSFVLIIEGYMANSSDKGTLSESDAAYQISYQRALNVFQLWKNAGILFPKKKVDVVIAGRGFDFDCRDSVKSASNLFSIVILPKNNLY